MTAPRLTVRRLKAARFCPGTARFLKQKRAGTAVGYFWNLWLTKRQSGESPKIGFLLGTRKFEAAVAELTKGTEVTIRAKCVYFADKTLPSQFECTAMTGGKVIGTASLTVYEPEDLKAWTN